jgi:hypothetical protein
MNKTSKQLAAARQAVFSFMRCKILKYNTLKESCFGIKMTQSRRIGDSKMVGMDLQIIVSPIEI